MCVFLLESEVRISITLDEGAIIIQYQLVHKNNFMTHHHLYTNELQINTLMNI